MRELAPVPADAPIHDLTALGQWCNEHYFNGLIKPFDVRVSSRLTRAVARVTSRANRPVITFSEKCLSNPHVLLGTMVHEMVHIKAAQHALETNERWALDETVSVCDRAYIRRERPDLASKMYKGHGLFFCQELMRLESRHPELDIGITHDNTGQLILTTAEPVHFARFEFLNDKGEPRCTYLWSKRELKEHEKTRLIATVTQQIDRKATEVCFGETQHSSITRFNRLLANGDLNARHHLKRYKTTAFSDGMTHESTVVHDRLNQDDIAQRIHGAPAEDNISHFILMTLTKHGSNRPINFLTWHDKPIKPRVLSKIMTANYQHLTRCDDLEVLVGKTGDARIRNAAGLKRDGNLTKRQSTAWTTSYLSDFVDEIISHPSTVISNAPSTERLSDMCTQDWWEAVLMRMDKRAEQSTEPRPMAMAAKIDKGPTPEPQTHTMPEQHGFDF